jgi:DNA-binding MarR family transcriptional regulator
MPSVVQRELRQRTPFRSPEIEAWLGLQIATDRVGAPWFRFLKEQDLTPAQYNVLRILRGAHPDAMTCGEIAERMITRDPDITRLLDRLERRGLATRTRNQADRRVVRTTITAEGQACLKSIDAALIERGPDLLLSRLSRQRLKLLIELLGEVIDLSAAAGEGRPVRAKKRSS